LNKPKKRKCPWFWKRQESCPDCGWVAASEVAFEAMIHRDKMFNCPRCHAIYNLDDFWKEYHDKYSLQIREEE